MGKSPHATRRLLAGAERVDNDILGNKSAMHNASPRRQLEKLLNLLCVFLGPG